MGVETVVNEKTSLTVTASFTDENDVSVIPSTATYRVDDVVSGQPVVAVTALTPAASVEIEIPAAANAMVDATRDYEQRKVTVEFTYGTGKGGAEVYTYAVKNLQFVS